MPVCVSLLGDVRNFLTNTALILSELYYSEKVTFNELVERIGLPRGTISIKLKEFKENGWIISEKDLKHSQKILYSLTPIAREELKKYLTRDILSLVESGKNEIYCIPKEWKDEISNLPYKIIFLI